VPAEQAARVDLELPAALGEALRERQADFLPPLGMRDHRLEALSLRMLGEGDRDARRADERNLDQHRVRAFEDVAAQVLAEKPARRGELIAEPEL
jgi:hypothetical protein